MIRVSLVEDDDDIRLTLSRLIEGSDGFTCVSTYSNAEDAIAGLAEDAPDVVLLDIRLPGMTGIEAVPKIRQAVEAADIVMLTVLKDDELVFEALRAGASGYLIKDSGTERILDAITEVRAGGAPMSSSVARQIVRSFRAAEKSPLSPRETDVLGELCKGSSYRAIAEALHVSEDTVHFHIKNIYKKLQVHSKSEAVAKAIKDRLV
ncbi:MAG: response regulator transcription factor [Gemmatimonadetes bacterium]|nr:response regulator transcription factor [Gemmatimonadota bacterium]